MYRAASLHLVPGLLGSTLLFATVGVSANAQQKPSYIEQAQTIDQEAAKLAPPGSPGFFRARRLPLEHLLRSMAASPRLAPPRQGPPDVNRDYRFRQNLILMLKSSMTGIKPRIFGGMPSLVPNVVELEGSGGRCTGTLVTPSVVLTAGHCECDNSASTAFFGSDASDPKNGNTIKVDHGIPKTACSKTVNNNYIDPGNDFALVWLTTASSVTPAVLAKPSTVLHVPDVRAVGFGYTQNGIIDRKMETDIPVASPDCTGEVNGEKDADYYGCAPKAELVAAVLSKSSPRHDTCIGDSGGPIFVRLQSGALLLAGTTSRGVQTPGAAECGDGGNYGLLSDTVIHWMAEHGVHVKVAN